MAAKKTRDNGVYGSGLAPRDWLALRAILLPFIHADDPRHVKLPRIPARLGKHPLVRAVRRYRRTGDDRDLDAAGRLLVPTRKRFGWYVALTK